MTRKEGAKPKLLRYLLANVGKEVPGKTLAELCKENGSSWSRSMRRLKEDGWEYEYNYSKKTYKLLSDKPNEALKKDGRYISKNLRAIIEMRDLSTCQMCGRNVSEDHIKIQIDHIIPLSWGGSTVLENLQCLCRECNEGKKNWEAGENPALMKNIIKSTSAAERLRLYFIYYPNQEISSQRLSVIAKTRDWTREVRRIRKEYKMDIEALPRKRGVRDDYNYIYHLSDEIQSNKKG